MLLVKTHAQNFLAVNVDFINKFLLFVGCFISSRNDGRLVRHDSTGSAVFQYIILTHVPYNYILHINFSKSAHYQQQAYWLIVYKHCLEIFLEADMIRVVFQFKGTRSVQVIQFKGTRSYFKSGCYMSHSVSHL